MKSQTTDGVPILYTARDKRLATTNCCEPNFTNKAPNQNQDTEGWIDKIEFQLMQQQTGPDFIYRPGQAVSNNNCCEPHSTTKLRTQNQDSLGWIDNKDTDSDTVNTEG